MLLVFHTPGTHGGVGEQIADVAVVGGIEHLVGGAQACGGQYLGVEPPDGDDTLQHVLLALRVGLVQQAFVALSGGPGLVGVDPGDQNEPVADLLLQSRQPGAVVQHRVLPVGGAGADEEHQPIRAAGENLCDLPVPHRLGPGEKLGQGIAFLDLLGDRELAVEVHILHNGTSLCGNSVFTLPFYRGNCNRYLIGGGKCRGQYPCRAGGIAPADQSEMFDYVNSEGPGSKFSRHCEGRLAPWQSPGRWFRFVRFTWRLPRRLSAPRNDVVVFGWFC